MNRKLRALAIIVGAGFLIFLILTILLNRFFSQERLQALLIDPAQRELGRVVTLGSVKASLLRGITITDIGIKERNSSEDFISVKTFRLRYELLPLLRKKLLIKEVLVDEPRIKVIRGKDGLFNFADIGRKRQEKKKELIATENDHYREPFPLSLTFDRVRINKAILTLTDDTNILPEVHGAADVTLSLILGKTLADTKYSGSLNLLANGKYRGHKPVLQIVCTITEKLISYNGNLTVGLDRIMVRGWAANYLTTPDVELNAEINSLDLDELASLQQFISDNSELPSAKTPQPGQPNQPRPAAEETQAALNLSAHGKVNIGQITKGRVKIREITLAYRIKDKMLRLAEVGALIFDGHLRGEAALDIAKTSLAFQGKIKGQKINVAEMMTALDEAAKTFSGELETDLTFRGSGTKWPVVRQSLTAEGRFTLKDGGLQHTPLTEALAALLAVPELSDLRFKEFSGDYRIANGQLLLDSSLHSRDLSILAAGTVGLDGRLNLPLTLRLSPEYGKKLGSNVSRYLADEQGHTTLHLRAKGSVQAPVLTMDGKGLKKQATQAIGNKLIEELDRAINKNRTGPDLGNATDPVKELSEQLLKKLQVD